MNFVLYFLAGLLVALAFAWILSKEVQKFESITLEGLFWLLIATLIWPLCLMFVLSFVADKISKAKFWKKSLYTFKK